VLFITEKTNTLLSSATSSPLLLAKRIHVSTHLPGADIRRLVSATIAPKLLSAADEAVIHSISRACTVCQRTADPLPHPKVSLRKPLRDWNTKVVADLFYLPNQVGKSPILHVRDSATGYSATAIIPSRDLEVLFSFFKTTWVHRHGSPHSVSADPEFLPMAPHLEAIGIRYLRAPARRHQTIGIAETRHRVLRRLMSRLPHIEHCFVIPPSERLSHATYLSNLLLGSRIVSAFEQARGYFPALLGLKSRLVSDAELDLHQDTALRRAVHLFLRSPQSLTL
jgi:hypothetical protein